MSRRALSACDLELLRYTHEVSPALANRIEHVSLRREKRQQLWFCSFGTPPRGDSDAAGDASGSLDQRALKCLWAARDLSERGDTFGALMAADDAIRFASMVSDERLKALATSTKFLTLAKTSMIDSETLEAARSVLPLLKRDYPNDALDLEDALSRART